METITENDELVSTVTMRDGAGNISGIDDENDRIEMFIMWFKYHPFDRTGYSTIVLRGASLRYRIELSVAPD